MSCSSVSFVLALSCTIVLGELVPSSASFARDKQSTSKSPQIEMLKQRVAQLVMQRDYENLRLLIQMARENEQRRRMAKCLAVFQSKSICDQSASFYLWAKMAAQGILNGDR